MVSSFDQFRAAESGVDSCVFGAIAVVLAFVLAAPGLVFVLSGFRMSRLT